MKFVNNEPEQIELRRAQNTLIVVGTGIILFGFWSAAKLLGSLLILRKETIDMVVAASGTTEGVSERALFIVLFVFTTIIVALLLALRAFIGRAAIDEGRGKRRGILYLVLTALFIVGSALSIITDIRVIFFSEEAAEQFGALTPDQSLTALVIEVTSLIMLIEMVISSIKVRKLTGKAKHLKD